MESEGRFPHNCTKSGQDWSVAQDAFNDRTSAAAHLSRPGI